MKTRARTRGRTDSRTPEFEMQTIIEEVMYLISLGYKTKQKRYILSGMAIAIDSFAPEEWIKICDETLAWHCKNFYTIGWNHELSKRFAKRHGH